jgi:uncharacterized protein (TIGR03437 family)
MSNWGKIRFNKRKITWGLGGAFVALGPVLLWAHSYGPDPGSSGDPKDPNGALACATSGCHTGSAKGGPINAFSGFGVSAAFSGGMTYIPNGPAVTITVTVTDPVNKKYGFQMTARTASDAQAGSFSYGASVANMLILCTDTTFGPQNPVKNGISCPASTPLEFIEHDYLSYTLVGSTPYTFTWTPPAGNVGNITFYVAGNAVNGNGQSDAGDHVSTAVYTMTPAPSCANTSAVTIASINSATDFGGWSNFASGSYLEIKGTNLAPDARIWLGSDFNGNNAPTMLDNVTVSINGKSAYVYYISPTQIDVQAPDDSTTGSNVPITVTNCQATSNSMMVSKTMLAAGMQAPASFVVNGTQYMVALIGDSTLPLGYAFVGNASLSSPPYYYRPAKPGQSIIAYGLGFGPVSPTNASGVVTTVANSIVSANAVSISFGTTPATATISYQGLAPGFVGLYQFNITVPSPLADGDYPITVKVGGTALTQKLSLTVHN